MASKSKLRKSISRHLHGRIEGTFMSAKQSKELGIVRTLAQEGLG